MDYKALKWSVHDNPNNPGEPCIGVIALNRPEKLNAVDPLMRLELDALCSEIARNSIVKVVILTGEGRGFCAGGDLKSEGDVLGAFEGSHGYQRPVQGDGRVLFQRSAPSGFAKRHAQARRFTASDDRRHQRPGGRRRSRDGDLVRYAHRLGSRALRRSGGAGRLRARERRRTKFAQVDRHRSRDASDSYRRDHRCQRSIAHRSGRRSRAGGQASRHRVRSCRAHRGKSLFVRAASQTAGENVLELESHRRRLSAGARCRAGNYPNQRLPRGHARLRAKSARRAIPILTTPTGRFRKKARQRNPRNSR